MGILGQWLSQLIEFQEDCVCVGELSISNWRCERKVWYVHSYSKVLDDYDWRIAWIYCAV